MRELTAGEVQRLVGGKLYGDENRVVTRVSPIDDASAESLSFVASKRYQVYLQATLAGVVLVTRAALDAVPEGCTAIVVADPHVALLRVLTEAYSRAPVTPGVHVTAVIAGTATISPEASIGAYAVVGEGVTIGSSEVGAHVVIGDGCTIGDGVEIHPHVTLYDAVSIGNRAIIHSGARIGKPGFGFVWEDGGHRKIPQVGGCVIEEDVEIGANTTVDRGSIGPTVVGAGTKIENLVHVGHNVRVGRHGLLMSQVGIAGSSQIQDGAVLAGQVGIAGHLQIGSQARIGAQAGVISDVPAGETYSGYPARPHREALRAQAGLFKLPELFKRLQRLEAAVFGNRVEK